MNHVESSARDLVGQDKFGTFAALLVGIDVASEVSAMALER
ncbi:MAG: hypothetical protein ACYDB2_03640 [Acidimicrobiales bacterium]